MAIRSGAGIAGLRCARIDCQKRSRVGNDGWARCRYGHAFAGRVLARNVKPFLQCRALHDSADRGRLNHGSAGLRAC